MAKKSSRRPANSIASIAMVLLLLGIIGLAVAYSMKSEPTTPASGTQELEVVDGSNLYPQHSQQADGTALQGAARGDAITSDKNGDELQANPNQNIQSVSDLDALLKNNDLNVE